MRTTKIFIPSRRTISFHVFWASRPRGGAQEFAVVSNKVRVRHGKATGGYFRTGKKKGRFTVRRRRRPWDYFDNETVGNLLEVESNNMATRRSSIEKKKIFFFAQAKGIAIYTKIMIESAKVFTYKFIHFPHHPIAYPTNLSGLSSTAPANNCGYLANLGGLSPRWPR